MRNALSQKISYYKVSPNYEILMFDTDVTRIISLRDFKSNEFSRNLTKVFEDLDNFNYDDQTDTNIAKLYWNILLSMQIDELYNPTAFLETQHIVIVFTDGKTNMGGIPHLKWTKLNSLSPNMIQSERRNSHFMYLELELT
ncbi:complement C2-like isoform X2 [Sinocyclocheilus grahami]|uniref:complement C2-like isoform X2 n=1 Tax=Sinocyclocheilus grahami TaxID=75366 RepID=UPI0007ACAF4C|nr:PREDICTED: complement C2-like isoform X2 [Sinocyclocheilus grahami]